MPDEPAVLRPAEIFAALAGCRVRYLTIGGFAVNAHGVPRATFELDITVALDADNVRRLAAALHDLDAPEVVSDIAGFIAVDPRDEVDLARARTTRVPTRAGVLDILTAPTGARPFEILDEQAVEVEVQGVVVRVVGRDDLIAMKRAAGRPKDLADIADLLRAL